MTTTRPTLHYFGSPGALSREVGQIATQCGFEVVYRTSERFSEDIKSFGDGTDWIVENSLDEAMGYGPSPGPNDFALSVSSPWIFNREFIRIWNGRFFNVHSSRLPKFRGGGGLTWPILLRERFFGVSILELTEGIDDGPIYSVSTVPAFRPDYKNNIAHRLELNAIKQLRKGLPKLLKADYRTVKQRESSSEYWPRINSSSQAFVDWSWKAREIVQFSLAFEVAGKHAMSEFQGSTVELVDVQFVRRRKIHPFAWGLIFRKSPEGDRIYVAANGGEISMGIVFAGNPVFGVSLGDRLFTSTATLEGARVSRPRLLPSGRWT